MTQTLPDIALSMLDLVAVREGGTVADALAIALRTAQHAESLGFKRYWLAEHHNMAGIASSATAVLVGHIAGGTRTMRVGSGGVMLPNHAPLVVAEAFGTLAELQQLLGPVRGGQPIVAMPGAGTQVPIWLLGSSLFSARLAAERGLPYAFASHFAPRLLLQALELYRGLFRPSATLAKPYVVIGVPLIAAPTDDEAEFLASSTYQRVLGILTGDRQRLQPPVADFMAGLIPQERAAIADFLAAAVIGGPDTVRAGLARLAEITQADEFMLVCDVFDPALRLRSLDIAAQVMR